MDALDTSSLTSTSPRCVHYPMSANEKKKRQQHEEAGSPKCS